MFIASDLLAFAGLTNKIVFLPDGSFALVRQNDIELYDFSGKRLLLPIQDIPIVWYDDDKHGYEHYMLKEIFEQKNAIYSTVRNLNIEDVQAFWKQCNISIDTIKRLQSITLIGCGSSWHAARIAQFYFEYIAQVPTSVVLASEFRYMSVFNKPDTLYIAISQSGETADTLEVVRLLNSMNVQTLALTNVALSSIVREAHSFFLTHAGQEVSVASTKAFSTQLAALYCMAHAIAFQKGIIDHDALYNAYNDLHIAAETLENSIEKYRLDIINHLAPYYAQFEKFIFLGRHISYPFAMEAALKLKEVSYIFAQCYPAGELKHGPIALLSDDTPVVLFSTLDPLIYQKLLSNAQQVKARNGHLIVFAFEGQDELSSIADCVFSIPKVHPLLGPLAMTGLMQFFVYHIAKVLGCPIDKPRNLAKSVTVE